VRWGGAGMGQNCSANTHTTKQPAARSAPVVEVRRRLTSRRRAAAPSASHTYIQHTIEFWAAPNFHSFHFSRGRLEEGARLCCVVLAVLVVAACVEWIRLPQFDHAQPAKPTNEAIEQPTTPDLI